MTLEVLKSKCRLLNAVPIDVMHLGVDSSKKKEGTKNFRRRDVEKDVVVTCLLGFSRCRGFSLLQHFQVPGCYSRSTDFNV
jgi:hypothetical protein